MHSHRHPLYSLPTAVNALSRKVILLLPLPFTHLYLGITEADMGYYLLLFLLYYHIFPIDYNRSSILSIYHSCRVEAAAYHGTRQDDDGDSETDNLDREYDLPENAHKKPIRTCCLWTTSMQDQRAVGMCVHFWRLRS